MTVCKPKIVGGNLSSHEVAQIFAGDKQSFAVTRQGKIFAWGKNEHVMLGFRDRRDELIKEPEELILGAMGNKSNAAGCFTGGNK